MKLLVVVFPPLNLSLSLSLSVYLSVCLYAEIYILYQLQTENTSSFLFFFLFFFFPLTSLPLHLSITQSWILITQDLADENYNLKRLPYAEFVVSHRSQLIGIVSECNDPEFALVCFSFSCLVNTIPATVDIRLVSLTIRSLITGMSLVSL